MSFLFKWLLLGAAAGYLTYLLLTCYSFRKKREKIQKMIRIFENTNSREVFGIDLIQAQNLSTHEYDLNYSLQVLGEGPMARSLLQNFLEGDLHRKRSIILIAFKEEKELLEELTYIFRDRKPEEVRSFFYFSLKDPRSASYSPFHEAEENFLEGYLGLDWLGREAVILRQLLKALKTVNKPFELEDLILLLENKRAVMALNEITLNREYLWHFDSLKKFRLALCEELRRLGKNLRLEKYPITDGFPLDLGNILGSEKHLFIELGSKPSMLMCFFFDYLKYQINERNSYLKPVIYLIHPEKFEDSYPLEAYFKNLAYGVCYRIFSKRFSLLYRYSQNWHTVFLPSMPSEERAKDPYKHFWEETKSIQNEDAFKSAKALAKKLGIKTAWGFFYQYHEGSHKIDFRWLCLSETTLGKMEYEPYQKRFKPEDMLCLRDRMVRIKPDLLRRDPGVTHIIQDLKPKNNDSSMEVC